MRGPGSSAKFPTRNQIFPGFFYDISGDLATLPWTKSEERKHSVALSKRCLQGRSRLVDSGAGLPSPSAKIPVFMFVLG